MLGIDFIKANREAVERAVRDKNVALELDALLGLDGEARGLKTADRRASRRAQRDQRPLQGCRRRRRKPSLAAGPRMPAPRRASSKASLREAGGAQGAAAEDCPTSRSRARRSGPTRASTPSSARKATPPKFGFEPLDHVALIEKNDWADLSRITQVSGSPHLLPERAAGAARGRADELGAAEDRRRRLHADHRAGDRARAGVPQPGPVPRA